jgi:hypothetical protein
VTDETYISVAETAKLLHRSTEQVRRYLREGDLPGRRIGGQWFIERNIAEQFRRRLRDGSEFAHRLSASDTDPLGAVIALGGSGGGDVAGGLAAYLRSLP